MRGMSSSEDDIVLVVVAEGARWNASVGKAIDLVLKSRRRQTVERWRGVARAELRRAWTVSVVKAMNLMVSEGEREGEV